MATIGRAELAAARGTVAFVGRLLARYRLRFFGIMALVFAVVLFVLGALTGGTVGTIVEVGALLLGIAAGVVTTALHRLLGRAERHVGGPDYPVVRPIVDRHQREVRDLFDEVRDQLGVFGILRLVRSPRRIEERARGLAASALAHAPSLLAEVRQALGPDPDGPVR